MTPFLQQVASVFYREYQEKISDLVFVFPNRRAGIFFQKYLAIEAGKPLFSPTILTISALFEELSDLQLADRTSLLFRLYEIFIRVSGSTESFDDFYYWGDMLLNDFDDVDKYVADAEKLFTNVTDLKQIEEDFAYLEEDQVQIIRRFWSHFIPAQESHRKENFAKTWAVLYEIYTGLRNNLRSEGMAYEGMIFRDVAELFIEQQPWHLPFKKVVFVGLNALTASERIMLRGLRDRGIADFYWDYQAPALRDPDNKASFFMRENERDFPSQLSLPAYPADYRPEVEVIGIPSAIGQTKYTYELLQQLVASGDIPHPEHAMNTAVVLPDENLLLPSLYGVPREIDPINVTMGYGLKNTPIAGLMQYVFELQRTFRNENGRIEFYHHYVTAILNHRYVTTFDAALSAQLIAGIRKNNKVFIPAEELTLNPLLAKIFSPVVSVEEVSGYLTGLLEFLQGGIDTGREETEAEDSAIVRLTELEKEFIYHYYITVNRLADVIGGFSIPFSLPTYFRLLRQLTETIAIPFRGEPLSGLQIMGVLETRALDFENQIILSMNEGVFPLKKAANSFIPFNLRKGFGLSTTEHQDAIYAYHFYRMISRAKKVFLLYDTRSAGMQTGEVSRFVHQLKYHYRYPLQEKTITYDISVAAPVELKVDKNQLVMSKLHRFLSGGNKDLSASAINTYLNCPLQFYFRFIEGLGEEDQVSESLESNTFGNIFHGVMEAIYKRCEGQLVTADLIRNVMEDADGLRRLIRKNFAVHFLNIRDKVPAMTGYNYLIGEVLMKYVLQVLNDDIKRTPFLHVGSEVRVNMEYPISDNRMVRLKGSIDRVDERDKVVRIIDYKTGTGITQFASMRQLFDSEEKERPKAVMQVQFYSMLYNRIARPAAIEPHIYYLRSFFSSSNETLVSVKQKKDAEETKLENGPFTNFIPYEQDFCKELSATLEEIFNPEIPFTQACDDKNCQYCHLATICKR
ncbi:MAG: PD-(D/E)XK nuclease family protein [Bacteroidales bacterium]